MKLMPMGTSGPRGARAPSTGAGDSIKSHDGPAADKPSRLRHLNLLKGLTPTARSIDMALQTQTHANRRCVAAREKIGSGDPIARFDGAKEMADVAEIDADVAAFLDPGTHVTGPQPVGVGGELIIKTSEAMSNIPGIVDTVRSSPDMVAALASRERAELASAADALVPAVDAAETIQAGNSLERMLAHQMAAAHVLAMKFGAQATEMLKQYPLRPNNTALMVEAARAANMAGRLMGVFQDGMTTLDRIRRGGRQVVTVQHVNVGPGGQAVVAGNLKAGAGKSGEFRPVRVRGREGGPGAQAPGDDRRK